MTFAADGSAAEVVLQYTDTDPLTTNLDRTPPPPPPSGVVWPQSGSKKEGRKEGRCVCMSVSALAARVLTSTFQTWHQQNHFEGF